MQALYSGLEGEQPEHTGCAACMSRHTLHAMDIIKLQLSDSIVCGEISVFLKLCRFQLK